MGQKDVLPSNIFWALCGLLNLSIFRSRIKELSSHVMDKKEIKEMEFQIAKRRSLLAQKSAIGGALRRGIIGEEAASELNEEIDTNLDKLESK
jgi:hypothetical protein